MSRIVNIVSGATATGAANYVTVQAGVVNRVYQCSVYGTGAVSATVNLEGSLNGTDWEVINTFTLSGTTRAHSAYVGNAPYPQVRANVTAISGTGAAVDMNLAI